jgi:HD-like signal output (HDOD) protein
MIDRPFSDLDAWVTYLSQADLPVLRRTRAELDALRGKAEQVNARLLANAIMRDPLLTLRVLAYIEERRRKSQNADITTIERALMMIGIEPFFRDFEDLPLVEDELKAYPRALLGLLKVTNRARKAALWAREWGVVRHDLDVDEVTVATLLHDTAEMLMWCFAPTLALQVKELQARDRNLRSTNAQLAVYGIKMNDLHLQLARAWHLPQLLTTLMDHGNADNPRVKNVALAVNLARHSANGWDDPALPDDYRAIEELLHVSHEGLMHRLGLDTPEWTGSHDPDQPQ